MDTLLLVCVSSLCALAPLLTVGSIVYYSLIRAGRVKMPGKSDEEGEEPGAPPSEQMASVVEGSGPSVSGGLGIVGSLFALIGFLLPWVTCSLSAGTLGLEEGEMSGSLTGIAVALQSAVLGLNVLLSGGEIELAEMLPPLEVSPVVGLFFLSVSAFMVLIPLTAILAGASAARLAVAPFWTTKRDTSRLARVFVLLSLIALCPACLFLAGVQATVGGVEFGFTEDLLGSEMALSSGVDTGFWITIAGLALAVFSALVASMLPRFADWLRQGESEDETSSS